MPKPHFHSRQTAQAWEIKLINVIHQLEMDPANVVDQAALDEAMQALEDENNELIQIRENIRELEGREERIIHFKMQLDHYETIRKFENTIEQIEIELTNNENEQKSNERVELAADLKDKIKQQNEIIANARREMVKNIEAKKQAIKLAVPETEDHALTDMIERNPPEENAKLLDKIHSAEREIEGCVMRLNRISQREKELAETTTQMQRAIHIGRVEYNIQNCINRRKLIQNEIESYRNLIAQKKIDEDETEEKLREKVNEWLNNADADKQKLKLEKDKFPQAEAAQKEAQEKWEQTRDAFNERNAAYLERAMLEAQHELMLLRNNPEAILSPILEKIDMQLIDFERKHPVELNKTLRMAIMQLKIALKHIRDVKDILKDDANIHNNEAVLFADGNTARQQFYQTVGLLHFVSDKLSLDKAKMNENEAQKQLTEEFAAHLKTILDECFYQEKNDTLDYYNALNIPIIHEGILAHREELQFVDSLDTLAKIEKDMPDIPVSQKLKALCESLRMEIDAAPDLDLSHRCILLDQTINMLNKAKTNKLTDQDIAHYQSLAHQSHQDRPSIGWKIAGIILAIAGLLVAAMGVFAKYKSMMLLSPIADPLIYSGTAGILVGFALYQYGNQDCVAKAAESVVQGLKKSLLAQPPAVQPERSSEQQPIAQPLEKEAEAENHFALPKAAV